MLKNKISPSILAADFASLLIDIRTIQNADMLHIDVMDGHFVPNISIGVPVVTSINKATDLFLDVHLMISDPLFYVTEFANAGADLICFHVESDSDTLETIKLIKRLGKKVGIALKPATQADDIKEIIELVDMVLVMTVEPGFGGQSFMSDMLPKIKQVRKMIKTTGKDIDLQVDGGITEETARLVVKNGANVLVAGSYIFNADNRAELVELLQDIV